MTQQGYWSKTLRTQISRRRALATTGSATIAAALLAACGGSSDSGGESSGLIYTPVDRTKEAKKGGVLKTALGEETTTWDPSQSGAQFRGELFSTMLSAKSAIGKAPVGEYTGEIMEKWEVAPDGLTMTFTMRPNAHFAPLPPTNGRSVDIEDIKQSWDYYLKVG